MIEAVGRAGDHSTINPVAGIFSVLLIIIIVLLMLLTAVSALLLLSKRFQIIYSPVVEGFLLIGFAPADSPDFVCSATPFPCRAVLLS